MLCLVSYLEMCFVCLGFNPFIVFFFVSRGLMQLDVCELLYADIGFTKIYIQIENSDNCYDDSLNPFFHSPMQFEI